MAIFYRRIVIQILTICFFVNIANAGWVDDWLVQKTANSPDYFQGQKRGYYSAGSFSARWKSSHDYMVTVESPKVKSGCGGIDVFLGGFSFLDSSHLVNKLSSILSAAAATAFDLALKTTCQQCANTIKNLESMADALNQMQIDDCAAGKSLVGVFADDTGIRSKEEMSKNLSEAVNKNKLVSGVSDLWSDLTKQSTANKGNITPSDITDVTSGCSSEIKTLFLTSGYLVRSVAPVMGISQDYADLIRGIVGDVFVTTASEGYKAIFVDPCPENNMDTLDAVKEGNVWIKTITADGNGTCSQITDTNKDLTAYVQNTLNSIAAKMTAKSTPLSLTEQNFLKSDPLSLLPMLKVAVASNTTGTVIPTMSELTAKAYSLQLLSDLYQRAGNISDKAVAILDKKTASSSQGEEKCAEEIFLPNMANKLADMQKKIGTLRDRAKTAYMASAQEVNTMVSLMQQMKANEDSLSRELTQKYGYGVANRVK